MTPKTYYAYIHCKPDGTPFYVGKGNARRSRAVRRVNAWHSKIVGHYGAENILIGKMECSTETLAFELEKGLIKCLRRMGHPLTNQTDGGEGSSGYVATAEAKAKIAAALTGIKRSDEFRAKMVEVGKRRGISPATREANIKALTGKPRTREAVEASATKNRGKTRSPESKARIADAIREWHARNPQHGKALADRNRNKK